MIKGTEECDDGNTDDEDQCYANCKINPFFRAIYCKGSANDDNLIVLRVFKA